MDAPSATEFAESMSRDDRNKARQHFKSVLNDIFRFGCCCCCWYFYYCYCCYIVDDIDDGSYGDDCVVGLVLAILYSACAWKFNRFENRLVFSSPKLTCLCYGPQIYGKSASSDACQ